MKKYRRILAGFLAMNLTISMASTNMIRVNADEAYQEETYAAEPVQTYAEEGQGEVVEGNDSNQASSGGEDASGWITEGEETIQETDAPTSGTETNGDDIQEEPASEADYGDEVSILNIEEVEPDESVVQADTQTDGTLSIKQFKTYKEGTKSVKVNNVTELILLSNCKPEELQGVTIDLNMTGDCDLSEKTVIKSGDDLSGILNPASDATSVAADTPTEDQAAAEADTMASAEVQDTGMTVDEASEEEAQAQSTDSNAATGTPVVAAKDYTYQSLGTEAYPFQGEITGQIPTIKLDKPFFGTLSSKATVQQQLKITWVGDGSVPLLANEYVFQDEKETHTLPTLCFASDGTSKLGSILGTVRAEDAYKEKTLTISAANVEYGNATVNVSPASGNAGLICNTLESGNICLDGYAFPASYTVQAADGNAGGIIGAMGANTSLNIKNVTGIETASVTVTSATGSAGGLVGSMGEKATIQNEQAVTLQSQTITGKYAGGIAGMATDVTFTGTGDQKITADTPTVSGGTNAGAAVGGFIGYYQLKANADNTEQTLPANVTISSPTVKTNAGTQNGGGVAGGYFGILEFTEKLVYKMTGNTGDTMNVTYSAGTGEAYGALIGKVISSTIEASLLIEDYIINSKNYKDICYHGGLIGELGENGKAAYLEVQNATVTITNPYVYNSASKFGGLVGGLAQKSILQAKDVIISTKADGNDAPAIYGGGGIVGCADSGSVVKLLGTTDLSNVYYQASANVGQLVGYQNNALIYAVGDGNGNGWTYKRSNFTTGSAYVNDIGNYGQVIRLSADSSSTIGLSNSLITINENHEIVLSPSSNWSGDITINSVDEFALLSIAWNSRGYFSASSNITIENWNGLTSKTIKLNKNINLEGTGISGLSRDTGDEQAYTGTFDGNSYSLTLAIGETFGYKGEETASSGTDGCGKVYGYQNYHNYQGLFSKTNSPSVIKNLTIDGSINISNAASAITAGGVAAAVTGTTTIQGVTVKERIIADIPKNNVLSVGGFFGNGSGNADPLTLESNTKASAEITIQNNTAETDDTKIYAGGVIGQISSWSFKLRASALTVSGSISTLVKNYAYIGGLAGVVKACNVNNSELAETHWMEIKGLVYDGFNIDAKNATKICGGLFGSIWSNVGVFFMGASDTDDGKNIKLQIKDATINAPNAASVGGLVYRSSGHWEIRDNGISLEKLTITAGKDVGLLVCRGEQGREQVEGTSGQYGALYLDTTKHWDRSYQLSTNDVNIKTSQQGVFDEFVAYTAADAGAIKTSGINGVVSIATQDADDNGGRVGVDPLSACTTYQNRTTYGKSNPTNGCSRYYYDLDQCVKNAVNSTKNGDNLIDNQEELMAWSVYRYAYQNIKSFFSGYKVENTLYSAKDIMSNTIGSTDTNNKCNLDMQKYSYYPIQLDTNVTIQNANIVFHNEEIENAETTAGNKVTSNQTSGTSATHTQHYTMHCGLFLGYTPTTDGNEITLNEVAFGGSIGKVADSAGVLFSGGVGGKNVDGKIYMADLQMSGITFDGLKVTNYTGSEYAPLLMNQIDSYTMLNMSKVATTNKYTLGTAAASSMIGNVGSGTSAQMNLSFLDIVLPDKQANPSQKEGIFTHATLLESYSYADGDTSVATYNFYKDNDWEADGSHKHQVTYGKEISETTEYPELQKWYYDVDGYGTDSGLVYADANNAGKGQKFAAWLPYVAVSYDAGNKTHEIKVNQRVYDIVTGCGTYGHPYVITYAGEMTIISEYLSTGMPRNDWKVTITNHQSVLCDGNTDITFRYNGRTWEEVDNQGEKDNPNWVKKENGETRTDAFMQRYMRNAYYDLQGSGTGTDKQIELENFKGFGTAQNPFRGVLTSTNESGVTLILKGASTGNGLIPYSYGSVVKNLTIRYEGTGKTLTYQASMAKYYPEVCFGGVIGCVLGGDNIIDNVNVEMTPGWLAVSESNKHLLQIGGYVGSVCGGGVLFRNVSGSGLTNTILSGVAEGAYDSMYMNPYVGRVLDGFAFNETQGVTLNNTNKNYVINTVVPDSTPCISVNNTTITVNDAKGLFLLSAIVNSGAASNGLSNAYNSNTNNGTLDNYQFGNGKYGKVRNAAYDHIGDVDDAAATDFAKAKQDDQSAPGTGNAPYLVTKYASSALFSMADNNSAGTQIHLASNGNFDMSVYSNGYQGISARYVSSAVTNGENATEPIGVVPRISGLNGNGNTLTLNTQVKEYADDDYHVASVGGVFNLLHSATKCNIQNLTLTGTNKTTGVSLQYYTADGETTDVASSKWNYSNYQFKESVGVGGLVGSTSGVSAKISKDPMKTLEIQKVKQSNMGIYGPISAGGLVGNVGRWINAMKADKTKNPAGDIAILIQPWGWISSFSVSIENCQYDELTVSGQYQAGGFIGYSYNDMAGATNSIQVTEENFSIVGSRANIIANGVGSAAGGAFGYVSRCIRINERSTDKTAKWEGIQVTSKRYSGGLVGKADNGPGGNYIINNVKIQNSSVQASATDNTYAGGVIGESAIATDGSKITKCNIDGMVINDENKSKLDTKTLIAGGVIGQVTSGKTTIATCTVNDIKVYGSMSGGVVGCTKCEINFEGCNVQGTEKTEKTTIITGRKTSAGILGELSYPSDRNKNNTVNIQNCAVNKASITSIDDWGSGGLIGDIDWNATAKTYFFNCIVEQSDISGIRAGGFAGDMRGTLNASNLLLKDVTIGGNDNQTGLLIGLTGNRNLQPMCLAGVSIQNTVAKSKGKVITKLYGTIDSTNEANVKKQSYFAFADYSGTALTVSDPGTSSDLLDREKRVSPYVVTSPKSSLYEGNHTATGGDEKWYFYGDGASWTSSDNGKSFTVKAKQIIDEKNAGTSSEGHYLYKNTGAEDFDFSAVSTYNDNQSDKSKTNFPVLQITGGNTDALTQYLDILTNGGFSAANALNSATEQHVTATATVYNYDSEKDCFIKDKNNSTSALNITYSTDNKISFSTTTDYDNEKNRYNLLKVTFTEKDSARNDHNYNVLVPVIVRRMLEMDFSATLSYGTNFRSANYENLTAHVLESFGSPITGYLRYTYNSDEDVYTDYGWQSYIEAGGNVAEAMEKTILFEQTADLPAGTQLTLIDCQNDSKAYYYTVTTGDGKKIPLSKFTDSDDKSFTPQSVGELMGVTAKENTSSGLFIKVTEDGKPEGASDDSSASTTYSKPTVRIKDDEAGTYSYYRLAREAEASYTHYDISVSEELESEKKSTVSESYYLVLTVPANSTSDALNGSIQTSVESNIPHQIHYRKIKDGEDNHSSTASTYQISKGYQQRLSENLAGNNWKKLSAADRNLQVDVVDTITFPNSQAYDSANDELYLRFTGGLNTFKTSGTSPTSTPVTFPSGATGTAEFYVYAESGTNKTYYVYQNGAWFESGNSEQKALSYPWTSSGGSMDVILSVDGTLNEAISLSQIRSSIKGTKSSGDSTFFVELKMTVTLPVSGLDVIPQSKVNGEIPEQYAKLEYSSQLSTVSQSLTYTSNRASVSNTHVGYYKEDTALTQLTYDADETSQLGINLLDLRHMTGDNALIDSTARYDLSPMKGRNDVLKNSSGIKFTLTLSPKNNVENSQETYQQALIDAKNYLDVELLSSDSGTVQYNDNGSWSWTIPKESYCNNGNIITSKIFDGKEFVQSIRLKVDATNVEALSHDYSNYKVVLTAEILQTNGTGISAVKDTQASDGFIYTLAKIKPEFVDGTVDTTGN